MTQEKYHISQNYKIVSAKRMRSDGPNKPRAIVCQLTPENTEKEETNNLSFVVWEKANPTLFKKIAAGIRTSNMPSLSGLCVVLNSSSWKMVW